MGNQFKGLIKLALKNIIKTKVTNKQYNCVKPILLSANKLFKKAPNNVKMDLFYSFIKNSLIKHTPSVKNKKLMINSLLNHLIIPNTRINKVFATNVYTTNKYQKGYNWYLYNYLHVFYVIISYSYFKTNYIHIIKKRRNTFFNVVSSSGSLIMKTSAGSIVSKDPQKGKKKRLSHTSILAASKIYSGILKNNKKLVNNYAISYKKNINNFNFKPILSSFLNQKVFNISSLAAASNKTFGFGCKLKKDKRKRTRRYKNRTKFK